MDISCGCFRHGSLAIHYAGGTDPGQIRRCNEDSYLITPETGLFAVADGLGGMGDGDLASQLAIAHLYDLASLPWWRRGSALLPWRGPGRQLHGLGQLIARLNSRLHETRIARGSGMATTLALVRLWRNRALIGHVGDSRVYLWRQNELQQLTTDHSLVAQLLRRGALTPQQAEHSPQRHVITRALGAEATVQPTLQTHLLQRGDLLLLCTDGLSAMVNDQAISASLLGNGQDCSARVRDLIDLANRAGGQDNITVLVLAIQ